MKKSSIIILSVIGGLLLLGLGSCAFLVSLAGLSSSDNVEESTVVITDGSKTTKVSADPDKNEEAKEIKAPFSIKTGVEGLKVTVTGIENDGLLKIFIKYENKTGSVYEPAESLYKIVAAGKQYEADTMKALDFKSDPLYELEDGVIYDSVLVFPGVQAKKFNLVCSINYTQIRVNNIIVE